MVPESAQLEVLACSQCGAQVALSDQPTTRCVYCQTELEVPPAYREAAQLAAREVENDALTREAFRSLGRPPGWVLRTIDGIMRGLPGTMLAIGFAVWTCVALINWCLDRAEPWFHVNAWDWLEQDEQSLICWSSCFALLLTVYVLGAFGRRRVTELRSLQRALAARPPVRRGGPSMCRHCGAPLSVPKNASGVRCAYCRCDNLVKIPEGWLERQRGAVMRVSNEAKSALQAHRAELRRLRLRLALRIVLIAALASVFLAGTVSRLLHGAPGIFDLRTALNGPRELFDVRAGAALLGTPGPAAPRVPLEECRSPYLIHANEEMSCLGDECFVGWFVALRAGESLVVSPRTTGSVAFFAHYKNTGWTAAYGRAEYWGERRAQQAVTADRPANFRAPSTSWYRVELRVQPVAGVLELCARIR